MPSCSALFRSKTLCPSFSLFECSTTFPIGFYWECLCVSVIAILMEDVCLQLENSISLGKWTARWERICWRWGDYDRSSWTRRRTVIARAATSVVPVEARVGCSLATQIAELCSARTRHVIAAILESDWYATLRAELVVSASGLSSEALTEPVCLICTCMTVQDGVADVCAAQ